MGGYGATRIGMKHADVFGSLYIMSPCCLSARGAGPRSGGAREDAGGGEDAGGLGEPALLRPRPARHGSGMVAEPEEPAASTSTCRSKDGAPQADVLARWAANAPLAFLDQYVGNLRRYRAIAIDVGDQDGLRADAGKLHDVLDRYGIANSFEIYPGTHTSHVADRFQNHVMPFFSRSLCAEKRCRSSRGSR